MTDGSAIGRRKRGRLIAMLVLCAFVVGIETHHTLPAFRAWTFGLVFLILAILTSLVPARLHRVGLVGAALALGVGILEIVAAVLSPPTIEMSPSGFAKTPEVGWAPARSGIIPMRAYDPHTKTTIFDVRYTIDTALDRRVETTPSGPAVVFFGDSFTFGVGLNDPDTLPQRFADLYGGAHRVVNLGMPGYAPNQFLREVETGIKDPVIGPDPTMFVFLTSPFQIMRSACRENWVDSSPRYKLVDGHAVYQGECLSGLGKVWHKFVEETAIYRVMVRPVLFRMTREDVDLYLQILIDAVERSKAKYGIDTLIPFLRSDPGTLSGTGYDDDAVVAHLRAAGLNVIDMTLRDDAAKGLVYSIPHDGHPTAAANRIRARMLADALAASGRMGPPTSRDHIGTN